MALIGYARVSSGGQDLTVQREALIEAGCTVIRAETASGTTRDRPELATCLDFLRDGDTLVVTRIDRLARSTADFIDIVRAIHARGAALKMTTQPIDTSGPAGEMLVTILAAFAQFETQIRSERQAEGIARAKADGVYRGTKPRIDRDQIHQLRAAGLGATAIAARLGIHRDSVYRICKTSPTPQTDH